MTKKGLLLSALVAGVLFTGCANQPQPLYSWGNYVSSSTKYGMNGHEKEVVEQHLAELKKIIETSEMEKKRVAPGLYAEYAQLMFETGKRDEAKQYFMLEKSTYPESIHFIDQVMKKLYGDAS